MEKLLTERVYHAEDQTTAFSEMIEEMGQRIFAYNSVKKSPQRILIENEAESLIWPFLQTHRVVVRESVSLVELHLVIYLMNDIVHRINDDVFMYFNHKEQNAKRQYVNFEF